MSVVNERAAVAPRPGMCASATRLLRRAWAFLRENEFAGLDGVEL